jgi:uncharacterized protein YndB with AHSA1/START domain
MNPVCPPDLSARPFTLTVEQILAVPPDTVFRAWTEQFDGWFASPGMILMKPEVNGVFFFETEYEETRHPHYGRFLRIERNRLVEMTWVTGTPGTRGAETVVTVELTRSGHGTHIRLTHAGFPDEETRTRHAEAWPRLLPRIEQRFRDAG